MLSLLILLSGCTVNYNVEFVNGEFKEAIEFNVNSEEYTATDLREMDLYAVYDTNEQILYDKNISENNGLVTGTFSYDYKGVDYNNSRVFRQCYDVYGVREDEEYYYIKTNGEFKCMIVDYISADEVRINFKTNHEVVDHNADMVDGNTYTWIVNAANASDKPINITISKHDINSGGFKLNTLTIAFIIVILVAIIGYLVFSFIAKEKDKI